MTTIKDIILKSENGFNILQATFNHDSDIPLWFKTKSEINQSADVFLACTLVPSMKIGEALHINYYISPLLEHSSNEIQNILSGWYPELKKIDVHNNTHFPNPIKRDNKSVACFFTGGVDSFYTLLKHNSEITKIVYVHGFDLWLHEVEFREMVSKRMNQIANELGKELIEVETNLLEFSHKICDWEHHYHGSALASVAILLSKVIGKMYIPSTFSNDILFPSADVPAIKTSLINKASHPDLDKLWSTEEVEIIHDGEISRLDKIKYISKSEIVLNHLRVCLDRRLGLYNCSQCEKCVRTMIALYISGVLNKSKTFENLLSTEVVSGIKISSENSLCFALENHNELEDGEIKSILKNNIDEFK